MAVRFDEIIFQNDNGVDVLLTVEAPVGKTVVRNHPVLCAAGNIGNKTVRGHG